MKKLLCLLLALSCLACCFAGCEVASEIAGNVVEAAKEELVTQLKATLEEHKVEVVEVKPLTGKINDGGDYQFYCAALVRTNAESSARDCANALDKLFNTAGYVAQNAPQVESDYLVHQTITYDHDDYSEGNYYTVYVYTPDLTKIVDLEAIKDKLSQK